MIIGKGGDWMLDKIKKPPIWLVLIIFLLTIVIDLLAILVSTRLEINDILGYVIYALAAIFLAYTTILIVYNAKRIKTFFLNLLNKNSITRRMVKEYDFRTVIFSLISLTLNLGMLAYYLGFTIFNFNLLFLTLIIYYGLLFFSREIILYNVYRHKDKYQIIKAYRICGILLILLPLYATLNIRTLVSENNKLYYPQIHVIVMAAITFYKIIMGSYNWRKARKTDDLVVISLRNINLSEALISILILQSTMFEAFVKPGRDLIFERNMNFGVGLVVTIFTLIIGISMVVKTRYVKKDIIWSDGIYGLANFYSTRK